MVKRSASPKIRPSLPPSFINLIPVRRPLDEPHFLNAMIQEKLDITAINLDADGAIDTYLKEFLKGPNSWVTFWSFQVRALGPHISSAENLQDGVRGFWALLSDQDRGAWKDLAGSIRLLYLRVARDFPDAEAMSNTDRKQQLNDRLGEARRSIPALYQFNKSIAESTPKEVAVTNDVDQMEDLIENTRSVDPFTVGACEPSTSILTGDLDQMKDPTENMCSVDPFTVRAYEPYTTAHDQSFDFVRELLNFTGTGGTEMAPEQYSDDVFFNLVTEFASSSVTKAPGSC